MGWFSSRGCRQAPLDTESLPPGLVVSRRGPYTILLNFTDQPLTATVAGEHHIIAGRDVVVRRTIA